MAGIRVDHGSHRLHPATHPAVLAELRELLGTDLQRRRRRGRIRLAGRWISFPLGAADLARRLPPSFAAAAVRDALLAPLRRPREDTFAAVLRAGLGPTLSERFYFPYARKLWGLEPEELAAEQARRRVSAGSPARLLRRLLPGGNGDRGTFLYPRRGYGQLSERLLEEAARAGADVRLRTAAEAIRLGRDGAVVRLPGGDEVAARRVWSTVPVTMLARMAEPAPPADVLAAAETLAFRSMLLVYLVVAADRYTEFDAHYLPEEYTPVTRISEPKNYRDGDDPAGRTVLCAEIPCTRRDELWQGGEEALGAIVRAALVDSGLPDPRVEDVVVKRLPFAYPVYRAGYEEPFARLDAWAARQPALLTFGRQGLFAHDNAHHALAMAWAAADALGGDGSFDDGAWAAARERFALHVVED